MTPRVPLAAFGFVLVLTISLAAARPATATAHWHTRLVKSDPKANDTLSASPAAVRLWFSERVELPVSRIRILDAGGRTVELSKPTRIAGEDERAFQASVPSRLASGKATVQWSTAGRDGHPMRGAFSMVIR